MLNKRWLPRLALLFGLTMALGACGEDGAGPQSSGGVGPKEIVLAMYSDAKIDVLDAGSYNGTQLLYKIIYDGLVEDGGHGQILPQLATSWEVSEDGKTYTFHLRQGVKFSDGTDFDAETVIFNLKRWMNDPTYSSLTAASVERMEAIDAHTVQIEFARGTYSILMELTYPRPVRLLSPSAIVDGKFTGPVGTGQWMVESYRKDQFVTFVPNPYYWGEKPKIDKLTFKTILDGQARVLALQSGEVDIVGGDLIGKLPMESVADLIASQKFDTYVNGTLCSHFIAFNNKSVEEFNNKNIRLAMNYAIDKKSIARDLFNGVGLEAGGLFQAGVPYVNPGNNFGYPVDKEKAGRLLDEAGCLDSDGDGVREYKGRPMVYSFLLTADEFPEWKSLAEFVQSEFASVGIKANLNVLDRNGWIDRFTESRDFDIALMRTDSDSWMPHGTLLTLFNYYSGKDYAKAWTEPGLPGQIMDILNTKDEKARQEKYDRLFTYINGEALTIPVYYPVTSFAVNGQKVDGFKIGVNNYAPIVWHELDVK